MKDSYNKSIQLRCITCGDKDFEFNEEKTWVKCNRCGKEYLGGYDELVE
jgi:ribosomal protein S27E